MSALSEILELLDGAARSYRTVRLTTTSRTATAPLRAALERHAEHRRVRGDENEVWQLRQLDDVTAPSTMRSTHIWHEPRNRWRIEAETPDGLALTVDDGERIWNLWGAGPAYVSPSHPGMHRGFEHLLSPGFLLPALVLEPAGESVLAGRRALRARATSRGREDYLHTETLTPGADGYELLVDAERGLLLRLATMFNREECRVDEVTEIAFDEEPAGWFVFEPPRGVDVVEPGVPLEPEETTLANAAARAPFVVLAPRRVPGGTRLVVTYLDGPGPHDGGTNVGLRYVFEPGAHWLSIGQSNCDEWPDDDPGWDAIERDGRTILARELGGQRQARTEQLGTHVTIVSDLALDLLVEIAASLEPVSSQH